MFSFLNHLISPKNKFKRQCLDCIHWETTYKLSTNSKNHYEVLNLSRDCTSKEIRDAFITLSKKYHPDKNKGNPKAQEEFVKVSEAYNVLIKTESRQEYDFSLKTFTKPSRVYKSGKKDDFYEVHRYDSHYRDPWKDPSFYRNRNFDEKDNNDNYYGVRGLKRQTNEKFLFWVFLVFWIGLFLQFSVLRFVNANTKSTLDRRSEENRRHLEYVRARAERYGTLDRQMEELKRRTGFVEEDVPATDMISGDKPQ